MTFCVQVHEQLVMKTSLQLPPQIKLHTIQGVYLCEIMILSIGTETWDNHFNFRDTSWDNLQNILTDFGTHDQHRFCKYFAQWNIRYRSLNFNWMSFYITWTSRRKYFHPAHFSLHTYQFFKQLNFHARQDFNFQYLINIHDEGIRVLTANGF